MRGRGALGTVAASPTMVGAVTVLITIVAVFLAYNANTGLPFVPSYRISVTLPDAKGLVPGNEVRVGGVRVGQIESIDPQPDPERGRPVALLGLKLDKDLEELPRDSTVTVRARSALGLKYLEINQGSSSEGFEQGAVLGVEAAHPAPVDIDEVLSTFDAPTRQAAQRNLFEFGNALAGRGPDLNEALGELPGLLRVLEPVMRNLGSEATGLDQFVRGLSAAAAEAAPVAEQQAEMFVNLDVTFSALAEVARPFIQEAISETPPTFAVADEALPAVRPFLRHSATLFAELRPGVQELSAAAPTIASSLEVGAPVLRDSPVLNRELAPTAETLLRFNNDNGVREGLSRLRQTVDIFGPAIRFIAPAQTVCNYGTILFRNLASATSRGGGGGRWQRVTVFEPPEGPNNEGTLSAGVANGGGDTENFLHFNPYPNTASPGQSPIECEAGNEIYQAGSLAIGNVPGDQGITTSGQLPGQLERGGG